MSEATENDSPKGRDMTLMALGKTEITILFAAYAAALVYSINKIYMIFLSGEDVSPQSISQFHILVYSALAGASSFYSRKLYKAGINGDYTFGGGGYVKRISTFSYFILRLPVSVVFAFILYSIWRLSIDISSTGPYVASDKAKYVYLLIGFFSGFSSGRILEHFEKSGFQIATTTGHVK